MSDFKCRVCGKPEPQTELIPYLDGMCLICHDAELEDIRSGKIVVKPSQKCPKCGTEMTFTPADNLPTGSRYARKDAGWHCPTCPEYDWTEGEGSRHTWGY